MIAALLIGTVGTIIANALWYFLAARPLQRREREALIELHRAHEEAESDRALSAKNHRRLAKIISRLEYMEIKEEEKNGMDH